MKTFVVIGLGRFGSALAQELYAQGNEVLAIDTRESVVQNLADKVTHAVVGDGQDPEVLRTLGADNYDCAIVATSSDVGDSVLITLNLKELGVPQVVCKARSHVHREVLRRIGADQVVFPELEIGARLARTLSDSHILNLIDLTEDYSMVEMRLPQGWAGSSLAQLDVRAKHDLNIIAVRREEGEMIVSPRAEFVFREGDIIFTLGKNESIRRIRP